MTKHVITTTNLVDDLDGSNAERTVGFAYEGVAYEMELSKKNIKALEKALEPFMTAGRRIKGQRGPGRRPAAAASSNGRRPDLGLIREWARSNGFEVSERGRIPQQVIQAYDAQA